MKELKVIEHDNADFIKDTEVGLSRHLVVWGKYILVHGQFTTTSFKGFVWLDPRNCTIRNREYPSLMAALGATNGKFKVFLT